MLTPHQRILLAACRPVSKPGGHAAAKSQAPGQDPASRSPGVRPGSKPRGKMADHLKQGSTQIEVNIADVIYAVDAAKDDRCWLLFGDPEIESLPSDPDRPTKWPFVARFEVDLETDDIEHLVWAVWYQRGWCYYSSDVEDL